MTNYYLTRSSPSHRWTLCQRPFSIGETLGPYQDHTAAKVAQTELNAAIPPRPKKPGGGRIAKPHVRHNLTIRADLSERLVKTAEKDGTTVTAVVENLIESHLKCLKMGKRYKLIGVTEEAERHLSVDDLTAINAMIGCDIVESEQKAFIDGGTLFKMPDGSTAHSAFLVVENLIETHLK